MLRLASLHASFANDGRRLRDLLCLLQSKPRELAHRLDHGKLVKDEYARYDNPYQSKNTTLFFYDDAGHLVKEELQKEVVIEDRSYEKEIRKLANQIEKIDKELGLNKAA